MSHLFSKLQGTQTPKRGAPWGKFCFVSQEFLFADIDLATRKGWAVNSNHLLGLPYHMQDGCNTLSRDFVYLRDVDAYGFDRLNRGRSSGKQIQNIAQHTEITLIYVFGTFWPFSGETSDNVVNNYLKFMQFVSNLFSGKYFLSYFLRQFGQHDELFLNENVD